jgi:hypothetical protein
MPQACIICIELQVPRRLATAIAKNQLEGCKSLVAGATLALLWALMNAMLNVSDKGSTVSALKQQLQQSGC